MEHKLTHQHYTMGRGKYHLVGIWSAPSKSMLESNPISYTTMMSNRPECCKMFCDHCGTPIIHHFILEDEDKSRFCVGSSCIEKLGQYELISAAQEMERERQRKLRHELAQKKAQEKLDKLEEQRKKNGGLTDHELLVKKQRQQELDRLGKYKEISSPIVELLEKSSGNFCYNMINQLQNGYMPSGNAKKIVIEIMTKQFTGARKNSKAFKNALSNMEELFNSVGTAFEMVANG